MNDSVDSPAIAHAITQVEAMLETVPPPALDDPQFYRLAYDALFMQIIRSDLPPITQLDIMLAIAASAAKSAALMRTIIEADPKFGKLVRTEAP